MGNVRAWSHIFPTQQWPISRLASFIACRFACLKGPSFGGGMPSTRNRISTHVHRLSFTTSAEDQEMFFSCSGINRAAELRTDPSWLSDAFSNPEALVVPVWKSKNLVTNDKSVLLASSRFKESNKNQNEIPCYPIFLGLNATTNVPVFAVDVSGSPIADELTWLAGREWVDLRQYGPELQGPDAGVLAYARGMVEWHNRNRFCGCCGGRMEVKDGGHSLFCSSTECGHTVYPRLDPAVIMLITCGNYVLLGRQGRWKEGRYSLLAGFVEIGETFEMAVTREVHEESGVRVDTSSVKYAASQPWPFPSSLMVGFTAEAETGSVTSVRNSLPLDRLVPVRSEELFEADEINLLPAPSADLKELEDVKWIHKDFLRACLLGKELHDNAKFHVPGKYAIANILMQRWVNSGTAPIWSSNLIESVNICEGVFKYVLISISDNIGNGKVIVRGSDSLAYHAEIFKEAQVQLKVHNFKMQPLGGGWIEHLADQRIIHIYGCSQAYGQANHAVTATVLRQWFPFHSVSFSFDN